MSKRFFLHMLRGLPKPNRAIPFGEHINEALLLETLRASELPPMSVSFGLEVGGKPVDLGQHPEESDLTKPWEIIPKAPGARMAMLLMANDSALREKDESLAQAKHNTEALATQAWELEKAVHKMRRQSALQKATGDMVPSLKTSNERPRSEDALPDVFTKCEISQVVQLPTLLNEGDCVSEIVQLLKPRKGKEETQSATSLLRTHVQILEQIATRRTTTSSEAGEEGAPLQCFRVNKLFREAADEKQRKEEDDADYTCAGPNESLPCFFNTLFYLQVKPMPLMDKKNKKDTKGKDKAIPNDDHDDNDKSLREGVARLIVRFMNRDVLFSTPKARFGLGVVTNGRDVVFVRVDLADDAIPVYVSEVLRLDSEQGLRHWARFMCCSAAEQFGLPAQNLLLESLQLASPRYVYVRALGSGGTADVVVVRDETEGQQQRELCCKVVRDGALHSKLLFHEARVLEKLQDITNGIPKLVSCASYAPNNNNNVNVDAAACVVLLTSPVGTPLREHMKTLRREGERHAFAQRVLEQLRSVLCAVHAKGIVHGDIKPDNLVVCANGEDVLLVDWGCAIIEEDEEEARKDFFFTFVDEERRARRKKHITPFVSDELLLSGRSPTPQDDEIALLLTCLALRESSVGRVPWPYYELPQDPEKLIEARSRWLEDYARAHPELDLTPLLPLNPCAYLEHKIKKLRTTSHKNLINHT